MQEEAAQEVQEKLMKELQEREARKAQENENNICQICQEPLFAGDGSEVFVLGVCTDIFHVECIKPWLTTCIENQQFPICCPEPKCKLPIPLPDL